jgi:hypothetical protein
MRLHEVDMQVALQPRFAATAFHPTPCERDFEFVALLDAFRPTGGLLRGDMLAEQLAQRDREDYLRLARKIASREMLSFRWNASVWLPAFQFKSPAALEVHDEVTAVLNELVGAMEGWEVAQWFVAPNLWLGGALPLSIVRTHATDVRDAARADRFIIQG